MRAYPTAQCSEEKRLRVSTRIIAVLAISILWDYVLTRAAGCAGQCARLKPQALWGAISVATKEKPRAICIYASDYYLQAARERVHWYKCHHATCLWRSSRPNEKNKTVEMSSGDDPKPHLIWNSAVFLSQSEHRRVAQTVALAYCRTL